MGMILRFYNGKKKPQDLLMTMKKCCHYLAVTPLLCHIPESLPSTPKLPCNYNYILIALGVPMVKDDTRRS
jgi:hypothetical protein